ncbi:MAG: hypothetical protein MZU84_01695 [Sphingobacterium sp.]|nr:hypothetical protein [Sphingobacterium sp.]
MVFFGHVRSAPDLHGLLARPLPAPGRRRRLQAPPRPAGAPSSCPGYPVAPAVYLLVGTAILVLSFLRPAQVESLVALATAAGRHPRLSLLQAAAPGRPLSRPSVRAAPRRGPDLSI